MISFRTFVKTTLALFSKQKIPRPRDPTVSESFQTKISQEEVKILMDPKGFMSEEEKIRESANKVKDQEEVKATTANGREMEAEFGFTPKGPEPTRYGDWEIKGKCVDF